MTDRNVSSVGFEETRRQKSHGRYMHLRVIYSTFTTIGLVMDHLTPFIFNFNLILFQLVG